MNIVTQAAAAVSHWIRPAIEYVSLGLVATLLVIYGAPAGRLIKKSIRRFHFLIRLLILVLICSFGYATFTVFFANLIADALRGLSDALLGPLVIAMYVGLGVLAERKRYM